MKIGLFTVSLVGVLYAACADTIASGRPVPVGSWESWTVRERDYRAAVWIANDERIRAHNAGGASWTMAHNGFSYHTAEEFMSAQRFSIGTPGNVTLGPGPGVGLAAEGAGCRDRRKDAVDWAQPGRSTLGTIRDQGECGSCYAYVAASAVEAAYALATPEHRDGPNGVFNPISLSTQQIIDYFGCDGGDYFSVWIWLRDWTAGLCMSEQYPSRVPEVQGDSLTCRGRSPPAQVTAVGTIQANCPSELLRQLRHRPVGVGVAVSEDFQFYEGGVFTGAYAPDLNHAMLAVGYGTEDGVPYYKLRNSWSAEWGEAGYMRVERGGSQAMLTAVAAFPEIQLL
jgi:hypothetical protein